MSKWEMVRLGDVCDVRDGTHDSPKYVDHGYPLVTSKNVVSGYLDITDVNYISEEDYKKINVRSGVDDGDIIMPMIGTIGNPVVVNKTFDFAIKNVALVKFIRNNVFNRYALYILKSSIFKNYIEKENRGGTQKFISLGNIRNFTIPLPPLETQKQIAKTLDTAAELLGMRKQQLAELDNLIKSTFYDMFGDPATNEKGWEVRSLDDICSFEGGSQPPKAVFKSEYQEGYIRLIQIRDYKSDRFMTFIPEKLAKRFCDVDDIMIGRYGPPIFQILKGLRGAYNVALMKAVPKGINREFLRFYLGRTQLLIYLEGLSRRTAGQDGIQMDKLKEYPIILPPLALQTRFTSIVTKIEEHKALVKKAIDETQYLFDSLMSEYFE